MMNFESLYGMTMEQALIALGTMEDVYDIEVFEETEDFHGLIVVNHTYELEIEDDEVLEGVFSCED